MDRQAFVLAANEYFAKVQLLLTGDGDIPEEPDFSLFTPANTDDYIAVKHVLDKYKELALQVSRAYERSQTAVSAPRLSRTDSLDTGRTLFANV